MALEIKGLKADALAATGHIARIRKAYAKLNEIAPAHATDVESIVDQITGTSDDVTFAATVLGNSAGQSDEQPKDMQKAGVVDMGKLEEALGSPEVGQPQTFHEQPDEHE